MPLIDGTSDQGRSDSEFLPVFQGSETRGNSEQNDNKTVKSERSETGGILTKKGF